MAIHWRCPLCEASTAERDDLDPSTVKCAGCQSWFRTDETLCVVCDAPNPWTRKTTLHRQCRSCGHTQMIYSHLRSA